MANAAQYTKTWREKQKARGYCLDACGRKVERFVRCFECRHKRNEANKVYRATRRGINAEFT